MVCPSRQLAPPGVCELAMVTVGLSKVLEFVRGWSGGGFGILPPRAGGHAVATRPLSAVSKAS